MEATKGEGYVLCLMPSCLYKIPVVEPSESGDHTKLPKRQKADIRLIHVSSASEGEMDEQVELPSSQAVRPH